MRTRRPQGLGQRLGRASTRLLPVPVLRWPPRDPVEPPTPGHRRGAPQALPTSPRALRSHAREAALTHWYTAVPRTWAVVIAAGQTLFLISTFLRWEVVKVVVSSTTQSTTGALSPESVEILLDLILSAIKNF